MIDIFVQSRYSVDRKALRKRISAFMKKVGVNPDMYTISIAIVGDRKMKRLHETYAGKRGTTPILAFSLDDDYQPLTKTSKKNKESSNAPTLIGEIVISYPQALIFASEENKLLDNKISEFAEHGLTKLLGMGT